MSDLFQSAGLSDSAPIPLAERLRPKNIENVVGQDHLLASESPLGRMLAVGRLASLILWGPPGVGKTTIARLIASKADLEFVQLSAVFSGVADLRKAFNQAQARRETGRGTLLFIDEIHRFNRAQQDGFLPYVEEGIVTLIGATTENPSFEINSALLSRTQVFVLNALNADAMDQLLIRARKETGASIPLTIDGKTTLIKLADGDGRYFLGLIEEIIAADPSTPLDGDAVSALLQKRAPIYDKSGENHYNLISALHKSVRASDIDAALYWLARMLTGGEDPRYITRRLVRMASEDIGLADPTALMIANEAERTYRLLGSPEGELVLAHAVIHLASAPKSNAAYIAFKTAMQTAKETGSLPPPSHSMNAPTKLMKDLGYGQGYQYDHDVDGRFSGQSHFPDTMARQRFYRPTQAGREAAIKARVDEWDIKRGDK